MIQISHNFINNNIKQKQKMHMQNAPMENFKEKKITVCKQIKSELYIITKIHTSKLFTKIDWKI